MSTPPPPPDWHVVKPGIGPWVGMSLFLTTMALAAFWAWLIFGGG